MKLWYIDEVVAAKEKAANKRLHALHEPSYTSNQI